MLRTAFWASSGVVGWVMVGYPATLAALPRRPWESDETFTPTVTLIVAAFRERELLAAKLRALSQLDYPADRLEVIVVVDEDEETAALAREAWPAARVLFQPDRGGKPAALNRGLDAATGEIAIMTDANNVLEPRSIRAAVRHFVDADIAVVAGKRGEQGSTYDAYEDMIRRLETRSGSVAAMSGEFVVVRREECPRFPTDAVVDDLWLLCTMARDGRRSIYEPEATSTESAVDMTQERSRRSRMAAGRFMMASELDGLPTPFLWRVLSHKFGRLVLPFLLPVALVTSLALMRRGGVYRLAALSQLALYGPGLAHLAGRPSPGPLRRIGKASAQFILGNYSVGIGVIRGARKAQPIRWDPVR